MGVSWVTYRRISESYRRLGSKVLELAQWQPPFDGTRIKSPGATLNPIALSKFQYELEFSNARGYYPITRSLWFPKHFGEPMFSDIEMHDVEFPDQKFNRDALWMYYQGVIYVRDERTMMAIKLKWSYCDLRSGEPVDAS